MLILQDMIELCHFVRVSASQTFYPIANYIFTVLYILKYLYNWAKKFEKSSIGNILYKD
jgi:hypothetical protein